MKKKTISLIVSKIKINALMIFNYKKNCLWISKVLIKTTDAEKRNINIS